MASTNVVMDMPSPFSTSSHRAVAVGNLHFQWPCGHQKAKLSPPRREASPGIGRSSAHAVKYIRTLSAAMASEKVVKRSCQSSPKVTIKNGLPTGRRAASLASIYVSPWKSVDQIQRLSRTAFAALNTIKIQITKPASSSSNSLQFSLQRARICQSRLWSFSSVF